MSLAIATTIYTKVNNNRNDYTTHAHKINAIQFLAAIDTAQTDEQGTSWMKWRRKFINCVKC